MQPDLAFCFCRRSKCNERCNRFSAARRSRRTPVSQRGAASNGASVELIISETVGDRTSPRVKSGGPTLAQRRSGWPVIAGPFYAPTMPRIRRRSDPNTLTICRGPSTSLPDHKTCRPTPYEPDGSAFWMRSLYSIVILVLSGMRGRRRQPCG
jgi:hypothetical protein